MSQSTDISLGILSDVTPATAWRNEVAFSEWLSINLGHLSDILKVGDLELQDLEAPVGDFRCDIVAREVQSSRVMVIENQFNKTDHDHLGKLLTYAAKFSASIVVWVSTDVRNEHRAAIDWLNKVTPPEVSFYAVQLRVISIDGSRPAPWLELRASPNALTKPPSSKISNPSPRAELYRKFFQTLIDELREKHRFTKARLAQPLSYYFFSTGTKGINYSVIFAQGNWLRIGIYIDVGDQNVNKAIYDALWGRQNELESALRDELFGERLDTKRACRISIQKPDSGLDQIGVRALEVRTWIVDRLLAVKAVFGPLISVIASDAVQQQSVDESLDMDNGV